MPFLSQLCFECQNSRELRIIRLDHAMTARQKEVLSIFGMSDDDMRAACHGISKDLLTIDASDIKSCPKDEGLRDDSTVDDEEQRLCQE